MYPAAKETHSLRWIETFAHMKSESTRILGGDIRTLVVSSGSIFAVASSKDIERNFKDNP